MNVRYTVIVATALLVFLAWYLLPVPDEAVPGNTSPTSEAVEEINTEAVADEAITKNRIEDPLAITDSSLTTAKMVTDDDCWILDPSLNPPLSKDQSDARAMADGTQLTKAKQQLKDSDLIEHRHAKALISRDKDVRIDLLTQILSDDPNNVLALWHAAHTCSDMAKEHPCPLENWLQQLASLDGENSQTWALIAYNHFIKGNQSEALESMRRAGSASESRSYFKETTQMFQAALVSIGSFTRYEELQLGTVFGRAWQPAVRVYQSMCREQTDREFEWAQACRDYGAANTYSTETLRSAKIANAIHVDALNRLDQWDRAQQVADEFNTRIERISLDKSHDDKILLLQANEELLSKLFIQLRDEGEIASLSYLIRTLDEAYTRSSDPACRQDSPGKPTDTTANEP